jgi:hypothetical protein
MSRLRMLQSVNPTLNIRSVDAPEFGPYGRVLNYDAAAMIARTKLIIGQTEAIVYEPSVPALEAPEALNTAVTNEVFGGMPVQVGWCYGVNLQMAGLEYHKGTEVIVCVTDTVLLLGLEQDIVYGAEITYDTRKVAAFYAPAGAVVEFFPWNLHFAPVHVGKGESFATLVYLPKFTNQPLTYAVPQVGENKLLFAMNKWLIVHPGAAGLVKDGAYAGMVGDDVFVNPL